MRALAAFVFTLFTLLVPLMVFEAQIPRQANRADDESRQEAERLWELAIAAKGGRERLYGIRNFVVSSKSRFRSSSRPDVAVGITEDNLFILLGKWWNFEDYRPGKMGFSINVLDFDRNIRWHASPGAKVPRSPSPDLEKVALEDFKYRFRQAQFLYLLETKWAKPTLVRTRTESIGLNKYDVIETVIAEREMRRAVREKSTKRLQVEVIEDEREVRADVYLDRKTHLPVRIVIDGKAARGSGKGKMDDICILDDYADFSGILMPQRVNCGDQENRTSYQFNVDYDESIFEHPPTPDMKPDAWRLTRK